MSNLKGDNLIRELLMNPELFNKQGKGFDLLQEYFRGYPLDTLSPLLKSNDDTVLKEAIWIASELGEKKCNYLLGDILHLIDHRDVGIKYFVMECIFLGTIDSNYVDFIFIIKELESDVEYIRISAMLLISNATKVQIKAVIDYIIKNSFHNNDLQVNGLYMLLNYEKVENFQIVEMLDSNEPLIQKYGAIVAKKKYESSPDLINHALLSMNSDVRKFSEMVIELLGNR